MISKILPVFNWGPGVISARLPVGLGDTLNLVLLLDGVAVGGALGGVDELLGEALSDGLDVAESSFASTGGEEPDGHVDTAQRRHVNSLATDHTGGTDAAGILAGTRVDHGIYDHLDRVLASEEVDDVHGVLHDAHSHHLLTVVATVHHQRVGDTLHDGALCLLEALLRPAASGVREEHSVGGLRGDVIREWNLGDLHLLERILVEKLDLGSRHPSVGSCLLKRPLLESPC